MAWTAEVKSKQLIKGVVNVAIEYTDGQDIISETYRAYVPNADWIPNTVRDRIAQLAAADSYTIPIGVVTPSDPVPEPDPKLVKFHKYCRVLLTVETMVNLGAIQADNPKVVALTNWIKNNADDYFDTLV